MAWGVKTKMTLDVSTVCIHVHMCHRKCAARRLCFAPMDVIEMLKKRHGEMCFCVCFFHCDRMHCQYSTASFICIFEVIHHMQYYICPKLLIHADSEILPQGQHSENGKSTRVLWISGGKKERRPVKRAELNDVQKTDRLKLKKESLRKNRWDSSKSFTQHACCQFSSIK